MAGHLDGSGPQLGQPPHHEGHQHPPADQVGEQGAAPEPEEVDDRAAAGGDGGDGHQEVLGEELAVGEREGDEPDAEGEGGQDLVAGGLPDKQ